MAHFDLTYNDTLLALKSSWLWTTPMQEPSHISSHFQLTRKLFASLTCRSVLVSSLVNSINHSMAAERIVSYFVTMLAIFRTRYYQPGIYGEIIQKMAYLLHFHILLQKMVRRTDRMAIMGNETTWTNADTLQGSH